MDNPSSMGSFTRIPTEVRMIIYRLVLTEQCRAILPIFTMLHQSYELGQLVYQNAAIFQTSKAISREAMDVFYSETLFNINLWKFSPPLNKKHHLAHPGLPLIQYVRFRMDTMMYDYIYEDDTEYEASVCRHIILGFSGPATPRNTLRLKLEIDGWKGFRVVEDWFLPRPRDYDGFSKCYYRLSTFTTLTVCTVETLVQAYFQESWRLGGSLVVEKLAPSLGPGVVEFRRSECRVEFQPRAHLAGKAARKGRVL